MPIIFVQNWEESERGWGIRPDGFTAHPNRGHRDAYVKWYYAKFNNATSAPDEYTRVAGEPIPVQVDIKIYTQLIAKCGAPDLAVWGQGRWFDPTKELTFEMLFKADA
jgi:hypothetical protein